MTDFSPRRPENRTRPAGALMDADADLLVVIDLQARLMPAISGGEAAVADAGRLIDGARALAEVLKGTNLRILRGTVGGGGGGFDWS